MHFEMGKQAATGEWKPEPGVPQVRASLPGPELLPMENIKEMERMGGFQLASIPEHKGPAPLPGASSSSSGQCPAQSASDGEVYAGMWGKMNPGLAQRILDTGSWDGTPITPLQRQVAYDFILKTAPYGPRQVHLEEV